jgi:hypothetical protein
MASSWRSVSIGDDEGRQIGSRLVHLDANVAKSASIGARLCSAIAWCQPIAKSGDLVVVGRVGVAIRDIFLADLAGR